MDIPLHSVKPPRLLPPLDLDLIEQLEQRFPARATVDHTANLINVGRREVIDFLIGCYCQQRNLTTEVQRVFVPQGSKGPNPSRNPTPSPTP
jgi:hypothetical protein